MSFETTVRETRKTLAKGGSVDVYVEGIRIFRAGDLGGRAAEALEYQAFEEMGRAQKWMESTYQTTPK